MSLNHRLSVLLTFGCSALLVGGVGCANHRAASPALLSTETFDAAWKIIAETHYDTNFNGLAWDKIGEEFRPQAAAATNRLALRATIQAMLDRLGDSHMGIIPEELASSLDPVKARQAKKSKKSRSPKTQQKQQEEPGPDDSARADEGDFGFDVRWIEPAMVVTRVEALSPAANAGIKPGWVLRSVDGISLDSGSDSLPPRFARMGLGLMKWAVAQELLRGDPGSSAKLEFLNAADLPVTRDLARRQAPGQTTRLGNLASMQVRSEDEQLTFEGASVGLIRFNLFMIPAAQAFDRAMDRLRGSDGIVLDLRGNLGGIAGMVMGLSGHFLKEPLLLGTMKTRTLVMKFHANPRLTSVDGKRVEPFQGLVAVLTDGVSASAAEVFAGGLQSTKRARVFGQASAGQVLLALFDRLPNGDVLLHAFADFVTADGVRLEGRGVQPDVPTPLTRTDLTAGRDPALEAAIKWITSEKAKRSQAQPSPIGAVTTPISPN